MYPLKFGKLPVTNVNNIIFISRPQIHLMDMIADIVHEEERSGIRKYCYLFFIPRRSQLCEKRLKTKGVYGNFSLIEDLPCDIFPFDSDVLSMEVETTFKDFYLEKDPTSLYQAAQAIMTLQELYGVIPKVTGKGAAASHVWKLLGRLDLEPRTYPSTSQIDHLILLDRTVDLLTPLATQLTYEGLIDELFEIKNTTAHFPSENFDTEDEKDIMSDKKQVILNSADELFAEIRDKNFLAVGAVLSKRANMIKSELEERSGMGSVEQMKVLVAKLPHILAIKKSLGIHTPIAELIKQVTDSSDFLDSLQLEQELMLGVDTDKIQSHIEDCIAHEQPLIKVLRLICMQSATNSGLKQKVLDYYKREIIHTYGFQHILTLTNLEDAGLLKVQQGSRSYTVLRKTLRLTVEDGSEVAPVDINYVHSIYAPLSVRLVQHIVRNGGWGNLTDVLSLLPGPNLDVTQPGPHSQNRRRASVGSQTSSINDSPKVVLVFFLGGCTYSEISALRFLSQQEDSNVEFVVATTKLINGNNFIKSLIDPI
nr:vacuolar protein sorting-associated protein 33A isoform X2 [Halyomorpha halys]